MRPKRLLATLRATQQVGPCWGASGPVKAGVVCRAAVGLCDVAGSLRWHPRGLPGRPVRANDDGVSPGRQVTAISPRVAPVQPRLSSRCGDDRGHPLSARPRARVTWPRAVREATPPVRPTAMVPPGSTCRPSTDGNQCDPAEVCTGTSVSCPADVIYARPAAPTGRKGGAGDRRRHCQHFVDGSGWGRAHWVQRQAERRTHGWLHDIGHATHDHHLSLYRHRADRRFDLLLRRVVHQHRWDLRVRQLCPSLCHGSQSLHTAGRCPWWPPPRATPRSI